MKKLALIEWTTTIQRRANWKDRDHEIFDENYVRTRTLKFLKIPLLKKIYNFEVEHELNEFHKSLSVRGFKNND